MSKTPGHKLYDLLNPIDAHALCNPMTWEQIGKEWHGPYERAAEAFSDGIIDECTKTMVKHFAKAPCPGCREYICLADIVADVKALKAASSDVGLKSEAQRSDEPIAEGQDVGLTQKIEQLEASLALCERRAEDAESRVTFYESELVKTAMALAKITDELRALREAGK